MGRTAGYVLLPPLELNELVEKLDELASDAAKVQKNFILPERKGRILGEASNLPPPSGAPDWALQPHFRKGNYIAKDS